MSKFKKDSGKTVPGVNTASLPDIVFMLLFFFMVATSSKESDPSVRVMKPEGARTTDMTPFKQRSEIDFLFVGKPLNKARAAQYAKMGMEYLLFMDNVAQSKADQLYNTNTIKTWKKDKFESKPPRMGKPIENVITCIKADKGAPSGLIFDIRKELQDIDALTVAYAVTESGKK